MPRLIFDCSDFYGATRACAGASSLRADVADQNPVASFTTKWPPSVTSKPPDGPGKLRALMLFLYLHLHFAHTFLCRASTNPANPKVGTLAPHGRWHIAVLGAKAREEFRWTGTRFR
jgi:hypothetical protein